MTEHNLPDKDDAPWLDTSYDGFMTHEEMLEEAARREAENKALAALDKLYQENDNGMKELAKELMKQGEGTVEKVPTEHRKAGADAL